MRASIVLLLLVAQVRADEPPPPPAVEPAPPPPVAPAPPLPVVPAPPPPAAPAANELDFNLLDNNKPPPAVDPAAAAKAARIAQQVKTRRRTLLTHQAFGLVTLGLLALTVVMGSLDYYDKFGGGNFTLKYEGAHEAFAIGSTVTFATTAALGLFAPDPYKKPIKADAALAHKILMGAAAACFIANLILGPVSEGALGQVAQRNFAAAHLGVGVGAMATMTAGWLAFVIK
jgi:hypothetical protein